MDSHSFHPPSLSPSGFFTGLDPPPPVQPGPRSYKSRKYRPCDFCRARQVACKIDSAPPCQLCSSHGRECTFVERPKKKRRPNGPASTVDSSGSGGASASSQLPQFETPQSHMSPTFTEHYDGSQQSFSRMSSHGGLNTGLHTQSSPNQRHQVGSSQNAPPMYNMDPYFMMPPGIRARPLDSQLTRSARYVGETGEANPYLLRHYRYDENDECSISKLTYRRITTTSNPNNLPGDKREPPVTFVLVDDGFSQKGALTAEDDVLASSSSDIARIFSELEALRLIALFVRFVYPHFPIFSKFEVLPNGEVSPSVLHMLPLSLLAAIYATALPFTVHDDLFATTLVHSLPPAHQLYLYSWLAINQEIHIPRLATLQACLLLLERPPTDRYTTNTPWTNSLVGWTVSLAQNLGLSKDCSNWASIPSWEVSLRRRLWFAVFIADKWTSLGAGMPSHIGNEDFDVLPLTPEDFETSPLDSHLASTPGFHEPEADCDHFQYLSELTMILSDVMYSFYSLRASQRTSKDFSLCIDLAHPLRTRLEAWNDSLPPALNLHHSERHGLARLNCNPSLSLAYIVASMTLFRSLLRPIEHLSYIEEADPSVVGRRLDVRAGARECANEAVEFVESLGPGALDAFWHSCKLLQCVFYALVRKSLKLSGSRANFAIASSFLMQLLLSAESEAESNEMNDLIGRWRWAMRIGSGDEGNGLMSLGLLRLDGVGFENGAELPGVGL